MLELRSVATPVTAMAERSDARELICWNGGAQRRRCLEQRSIATPGSRYAATLHFGTAQRSDDGRVGQNGNEVVHLSSFASLMHIKGSIKGREI